MPKTNPTPHHVDDSEDTAARSGALEAARVAAMDVATLAKTAQGTITGVQNAIDGSADWMLAEVRENVRDARRRLDSLDRLLKSLSA